MENKFIQPPAISVRVYVQMHERLFVVFCRYTFCMFPAASRKNGSLILQEKKRKINWNRSKSGKLGEREEAAERYARER